MGIESWKSNGSEKENEIKHWLDVYDQVFRFFQINNDNYFKRTQILMFAIQIGIATAFIKLLDIVFRDSQNYSVLTLLNFALFIPPLLGAVFAFIWIWLIKRQWIGLQFSRCYMKYIEGYFLKNNVPLAIFKLEGTVFNSQNRVRYDYPSGYDIKPLYFPESPTKKYRLRFTRIEELVACIIMSFWISILFIFIYCGVTQSILLNYYIIVITLLILIAIPIVYWVCRSKKEKQEGNSTDKDNKDTISIWDL